MISDLSFKNLELELVEENFRTFERPNGHITTEAMVDYIRNILAPCANSLQELSNDQTLKVCMMMDNCSVHGNSKIIPVFENFGIASVS
jgi:hypothetical protein